MNIGGNETGQAPTVVSKGTRPQDTVYTLDGVVITDMAAAGLPPTYFNFDNFEEIQVATSGQDIKQQTGGVGINLVTKRGTNQFHGNARAAFANEALESSNVPSELKNLATPVTAETADHNKQISDVSVDIGGPIRANQAWFYASYSAQDIQLVRRSGALLDRRKLKNPSLKLNWQADKKDMVSFLFFNGSKVKDGRSPGVPGIVYDAPTATFHQDNGYTDFPLHGLWKIADDRVITPNLFVSGQYAYYNTGPALTPMGGMNMQAGRLTTGQSCGSPAAVEPAATDCQWRTRVRERRRDVATFKSAPTRTTDAWTLNEWPGNGVSASNSPAEFPRAGVPPE